MSEAEYKDTFAVDQQTLLNVITDYEKYPEFVQGCRSAQILKRSAKGIRVKYDIELMSKDISYTLDHRSDPDKGIVEWELVESPFFKKNSGRWELTPQKGKTKTSVRYWVDLEFKVPVPGFILKKLIQGSLPSLVKSFEARAQEAGSDG